MATHGLSILEALENLNAIVDSPSIEELELTEEDRFIWHVLEPEQEEEIEYGIHAGLNSQTVEAIRKTFQVVSDHLQSFYRKMTEEQDHRRILEGINAVMVLVGEAAKKLEGYSALFKKQILDMPEYHNLQEFYRTKVIKEVFQSYVKKHRLMGMEPLEELVEKEGAESSGTHLLNDLNVLKEDQLYELFYLKNEAGYNFFTTALARNIKLACGFTESLEYVGEDPLLQIKNWEDYAHHLKAREILEKLRETLVHYCSVAMRYREVALVEKTNCCIMALMLAANPHNLIRQFSLKGCGDYFHDSTLFLREILHDKEYQKLQLYTSSLDQPIFKYLGELIRSMITYLFESASHLEEIENFIKKHLPKARHTPFAELLQSVQESLHEQISHHPNGPVLKAFDLVRDEQPHFFDAFILDNFPDWEANLTIADRPVTLMRIPCPTTQHVITKATITEEFKTYLRNRRGPLLYVNFQDRTGWKDYARCKALEDLSKQAEFAQLIHVVTLPVEGDFYQQINLYERADVAEELMAHLLEQMQDEATGFFFPADIKAALFPKRVAALLSKIHKTYFNTCAQFNAEERRDFISLLYTHLIVLILESVDVQQVTLSSKDGLDLAAVETAKLLLLLQPKQDEAFKLRLLTQLYGPTLLVRERLVHPGLIDQLIAFAKHISSAGS